MTSKERVMAAVEFKGSDKIPHCHVYLLAVFDKYPQVEDLYKQFPSDFAGEDGKNRQKTLFIQKENGRMNGDVCGECLGMDFRVRLFNIL